MKFELRLTIEPRISPEDYHNSTHKVTIAQVMPDGREVAQASIHPTTMLYEFIQGQLNNHLRQLLNELEVELKKQTTIVRRQLNND